MDLPEQILAQLATATARLDSLSLAAALNADHQKVVGAIKSLESAQDDLVDAEIEAVHRWELTAEGKAVAERGSHEAVVFAAVPGGHGGGIDQAELIKVRSGDMSLGCQFRDAAMLRPCLGSFSEFVTCPRTVQFLCEFC